METAKLAGKTIKYCTHCAEKQKGIAKITHISGRGFFPGKGQLISLQKNKRWRLLDRVHLDQQRPRNPYYDGLNKHGVSCKYSSCRVNSFSICGYCRGDYPNEHPVPRFDKPAFLETGRYRPRHHYTLIRYELEDLLGFSLQDEIDALLEEDCLEPELDEDSGEMLWHVFVFRTQHFVADGSNLAMERIQKEKKAYVVIEVPIVQGDCIHCCSRSARNSWSQTRKTRCTVKRSSKKLKGSSSKGANGRTPSETLWV